MNEYNFGIENSRYAFKAISDLYKRKVMNDTINTVNATTVANKEELAKILGIPADQITDVKVTEGKDEVNADADKAQTPAQ